MADTGLLTLAEASSLLRLKVSTLRSWVLKRRIPYCKIGGRVFFRRSDLDSLIVASVVTARPSPVAGERFGL
jgi:excisionase family DNA binding protein